FLENYWIKNRDSIDEGLNGEINGWVIPAGQRRHADAVDAVNELMRQGLEIHTADRDFEVGGVQVREGDYIARGDQPFRTLGEMYFSLQQFSLDNPRPYDDTGWTFQLMRNIDLHEVKDAALFEQDMTMLTSPAMYAGGVSGDGPHLVVDHTTDNNLMAFRFAHPDVFMLAAEADFRMDGHDFRAGAFIIPNADRATIAPSLEEYGLTARATDDQPDVLTHELDVPRIGYLHSWRRTQDEGWVRAALDTYGVPYDYFADKLVAEGGLRDRYDVIIYPHVGGDAQSHLDGVEMEGTLPLPYRQSEETPNFGYMDESDDIRGGMGLEGLLELKAFVEAGGTLIVEGSTASIFPEFNLTPGLSVQDPEGLVAPGSIHRGMIADPTSPIAYGYTGDQLPVYFKNDLVLSAGGGGFGAFARFFGGASSWQNTTPMASRPELSAYEPSQGEDEEGEEQITEEEEMRQMARSFGLGGDDDDDGPRVIVSFPRQADQILLSGTLGGGEALAGRAQVVDSPIGDGHVVSFAIRPFWRWQTQGTFFLGFNAILNWNDLDATGRIPEEVATDEEDAGSGSGSR
ncbi:MAG: hypothetical protein R3195_12385, partial [Gemmatimonadota bacterium]|nr:hypothetical protein [Gemmatimonadota bacterium]